NKASYDGITGAYYTEERALLYRFGDPYVRNSHTIFVPEGSALKNLNDLQKKPKPKVITQNASILINFIKSYNANADITIVNNYEQALRLLAQGGYDCAIISRVLGEYYIEKYALSNINDLHEEFLPREYSFVMHKKDSILVAILNQGLSIIKSTGKYDKIYNKYLKKYDKTTFAENHFKHIVIGSVVLILLLLIFYIYTFSLKRQVAIKTKQLAVELEEKQKTQNLLMIERDKARESDRLKSAFLANMSHEIRTPMNAIVGFSRLLNEPDLSNEERNDYVNIINANSEILLALINDIIDLAKIESKQLTIEKLTFCINDAFKALVESTIHDLKTKDKEEIEVVSEMPLANKEAMINTDIVRFNQIFHNLLANAVKFTIKGKIKLGYRRMKENYYEFFVQDTGIGIEHNKQEIIFEQFRQADESYTRKYGGTGLGLTICRELTETLGGTIRLESTPGAGTTITFALPVGEIEEGETSIQESTETDVF
ncbi:MAG: transporter substrate-binding domain-containing protein, partial [Bacteroidales bacterium]|nr:transporter substrate-binding domain-containing protein [Bacteroidales bacterium]